MVASMAALAAPMPSKSRDFMRASRPIISKVIESESLGGVWVSLSRGASGHLRGVSQEYRSRVHSHPPRVDHRQSVE